MSFSSESSTASHLFFSFFFSFYIIIPIQHPTPHRALVGKKMSAQAKGKAKEKPIASLLAGATAGGVEAFITFPLESVKTQLQFGALDGGKVGFTTLYSPPSTTC